MRELPGVAGFLGRPTTEPWQGERARIRVIARGLALAAPVLIVLGLLLASGDAGFASLFSIELHLGGVAGHAAAIVAALFVFGAVLLRSRTASPTRAAHVAASAVGPTEAAVARHHLTTSTEVGIDYQYLDALTTDAALVFAVHAARSPAIAALACRPDPDRSLWSANWSRWDAARHRDQLECTPGS